MRYVRTEICASIRMTMNLRSFCQIFFSLSTSRAYNPGCLLYAYYDWYINRIQLSVDMAMKLHYRDNNTLVTKAYNRLSLTQIYTTCKSLRGIHYANSLSEGSLQGIISGEYGGDFLKKVKTYTKCAKLRQLKRLSSFICHNTILVGMMKTLLVV